MARVRELDQAIDELDDIRLAVRGAARLAAAGEDDAEPAAVLIELAALLRWTGDALDRVVRRLDPMRDQGPPKP